MYFIRSDGLSGLISLASGESRVERDCVQEKRVVGRAEVLASGKRPEMEGVCRGRVFASG